MEDFVAAVASVSARSYRRLRPNPWRQVAIMRRSGVARRPLIVAGVVTVVLVACGSHAPPGPRATGSSAPGSAGAPASPAVSAPGGAAAPGLAQSRLLTSRPPKTSDGALVAVDSASGRVLWRQVLPMAMGTVQVVDGKVVVAGDYGPVGGVVAAVAADSGKLLWRWPSAGWLPAAEVKPGVAVAAGVVAVPNSGGVTVLDEQTGQPLWSRSVGSFPIGVAATSRAVVVTATAQGVTGPNAAPVRLVGLEPKTGRQVWASPGTLRDVSTTVASSTAVVALFHTGARGASQGAIAVDPATGRQLWQAQVSGMFDGGQEPVLGSLAFLTYEHSAGNGANSAQIALDLVTGAQRWRVDTAMSVGQPVFADDQLYELARDGMVRALDAATGRPRWTTDLSSTLQGDFFGSLRVSNGLVLVPTASSVVALHGATGRKAWTVALQPAVPGPAGSVAGPAGVTYLWAFGRALPSGG